jgi:hypothetical protein
MPGLPEIEDIWLPRLERAALNDTPARVNRWKLVQSNLTALKRLLHDELYTYIHGVCGPPCLQICRGMQEKLPRELRDIVYAFLLDDPIECINDNIFMPIGKTWFSGPPRVHSANHLLNKQFADPTTLHELLRVWYISRDFHFDVDVSALAKLIGRDVWGHDLPVYDLVKKVSIIWQDEQSFFEDEDESDDELVKELTEERAKGLECLFLLKPGAHINIGFRDGRWPVDKKNVQRIVTIRSGIFPLLGRLLDAGYHVTIDAIWDLKFNVVKDNINEEAWIRKIHDWVPEGRS